MCFQLADTLFVIEAARSETHVQRWRLAQPRRLFTHVPPPPLVEFVDSFWLCEGDVPPGTVERVLPAGTMELVIDLGPDPIPPLVGGVQTEFYLADTSGLTSVMGVHFRPGGAIPFLKSPASELQNRTVPLDALWGDSAFELVDRLLAAATPWAKFRVVQEELVARAARSLNRHPAVDYALATFHAGHDAPAVGDVAERTGLSPKRFIRLFTDEVGLAPKLFCRIRRFQQVLRHVGRLPQDTWTGIANDCGYYDQAHLIRDFRAFCGLKPTEYLRVWREHARRARLCDRGKIRPIPAAGA